MDVMKDKKKVSEEKKVKVIPIDRDIKEKVAKIILNNSKAY